MDLRQTLANLYLDAARLVFAFLTGAIPVPGLTLRDLAQSSVAVVRNGYRDDYKILRRPELQIFS